MKRLLAQDGVSMVEVLVAAALLTVGGLGVLSATGGSKRVTVGTERNQLTIAYAQREIERLAALPWASLALSSLPAPETDTTPADAAPSTPAAYLTGCTATGCSALRVLQAPSDRTSAPPAGVPAAGEPLVTGGSEAPLATATIAGHSARVYRYVTRVGERCLQTGAGTTCAPTTSTKRITVAIVLSGHKADGITKPVYLTTLVTDPSVTPLDVPA
jgi:Tfp pilus assembly protein PilV